MRGRVGEGLQGLESEGRRLKEGYREHTAPILVLIETGNVKKRKNPALVCSQRPCTGPEPRGLAWRLWIYQAAPYYWPYSSVLKQLAGILAGHLKRKSGGGGWPFVLRPELPGAGAGGVRATTKGGD